MFVNNIELKGVTMKLTPYASTKKACVSTSYQIKPNPLSRKWDKKRKLNDDITLRSRIGFSKMTKTGCFPQISN